MSSDPNENGSDQHDRRRPGSGMMLGMALGLLMGVPIGLAMDCLPMGIAIGSGMGVALGAAFEPRKSAPSPTGWKLGLLVGGLVALAGVGALLVWQIASR